MELVAALPILVVLAMIATLLAATLHGLILAFRAHVLFGIACFFFLGGAFTLFGVVYWIARVNVPAKLMELFNLHC